MKPMTSPYCTMESSAWAWSAKTASLAKEVYSIMQNASDLLPVKHEINALDWFSRRMSDSGYFRKQTRGVITDCLLGLESKASRGLVHMARAKMKGGRNIRQILGKVTWFLPRVEEQGSEAHQHQTLIPKVNPSS